MPSLFRSQRKGVERGNYKYMEGGKIVDTGTEDRALAEAAMSAKGIPIETPKLSFADLAANLSQSTAPTPSGPIEVKPADILSPSTSPPLVEPTTSKPEKPKPGTFRKNGLSELSAAKLGNLKEALAGIVSSGNLDAIRLVFSLLGYDTTTLDANSQTLLKLGWEAQLEELFVNGLPPPWLILTIANVSLMVKLGLSAKAKPADASTKVPDNGTTEPNK